MDYSTKLVNKQNKTALQVFKIHTFSSKLNAAGSISCPQEIPAAKPSFSTFVLFDWDTDPGAMTQMEGAGGEGGGALNRNIRGGMCGSTFSLYGTPD